MNKEWRDRLAAYDDAHLDERERAALDVLLDADAEARDYLGCLRSDRDRYCAALATVTARPGFTAAVMGRIEQREQVWWRQAVAALRPRALEVCAVGMMAMVGFAMLPRSVAGRDNTACQTNLRDLGRGLAAYSQDWDDRLPDSTRWVSATSAYRPTDESDLLCPTDLAPATGLRSASYGMPASLSGADLTKLPSLSGEIALRDADGPFLAPRHNRRANAAFLDGRVGMVTVNSAAIR